MNRRDLLKRGMGAVGILGLSQFVPGFVPQLGALHADEQNDFLHKLLVIEFNGGWDITLGLDPWVEESRPAETDLFIEYRQDELIAVGEGFYGPAMAPMNAHLSEFSVVRGVFLNEFDNGHDAANMLMRTGNGSGKYPHIAGDLVSIWSQIQNRKVISDNSIYLANRNVKIVSPRSLEMLSSGGIQNDNRLPGGSFQSAMDEINVPGPELTEFIAVREKLNKEFGTQNSDLNLSTLAALKSNFSRAACIQQFLSLDTHSNHVGTHLRNQQKGWEFLSNIISVMKKIETNNGRSLFSETTIIVMSEFSRTPALNLSKGKDHNPKLNAVLISGPGVQPGKFIGGSRLVTQKESKTGQSYHIGLPCDLAEGKPIRRKMDFLNRGGVPITPDVLMATWCEVMQVNRDLFGCANNYVPAIKALKRI